MLKQIFKAFCFLVLVTLIPVGAYAATRTPSACILSLMDEMFHDSKQYTCGLCGTNVMQLIDRISFDFPSINLKNANVVFFIPKKTNSTIRGLSTKAGPVPWNYHVVLEHENKIFDFDLKGKYAIDNFDDYTESIFNFPNQESEKMYRALGIVQAPTEKLLDNVLVKKVPAQHYIDNYFKRGGAYKMRNESYYLEKDKYFKKLPLSEMVALKKHKAESYFDSPFSSVGDDILRSSAPVKIEYIDKELPSNIVWKAMNQQFVLNLKYGSVEVKNSASELVYNSPNVDLFLRRIYLDLETNPDLKLEVEKAIKYRIKNPD